jgi:hypothetical protein
MWLQMWLRMWLQMWLHVVVTPDGEAVESPVFRHPKGEVQLDMHRDLPHRPGDSHAFEELVQVLGPHLVPSAEETRGALRQ